MSASSGASWSVQVTLILYCRNCASEMSARSPRQSRASARRLVDRLERHGDAAHGVLREVDAVDREQRIGRHQQYRLGLRPPERTCASAAARCNWSTTSDEARRPPIAGRPGN